jgi:hypothetical protein
MAKERLQINFKPKPYVMRLYKALKSDSVISGPKVCEAGFMYLMDNPELMAEALQSLRRNDGDHQRFATPEQCEAYVRQFRVTTVQLRGETPDFRKAVAPRKRKRAAGAGRETAGG